MISGVFGWPNLRQVAFALPHLKDRMRKAGCPLARVKELFAGQ